MIFNHKALWATFILLLITTPIPAQIVVSQLIRTTVASGETVARSDIELEGEITAVSVTIPDVAGTPTATLDIVGPYGIIAQETSIAENATTRLGAADFDVGDLPVREDFDVRYTLTSAPSTDEVIVTVLTGYGYPKND